MYVFLGSTFIWTYYCSKIISRRKQCGIERMACAVEFREQMCTRPNEKMLGTQQAGNENFYFFIIVVFFISFAIFHTNFFIVEILYWTVVVLFNF